VGIDLGLGGELMKDTFTEDFDRVFSQDRIKTSNEGVVVSAEPSALILAFSQMRPRDKETRAWWDGRDGQGRQETLDKMKELGISDYYFTEDLGAEQLVKAYDDLYPLFREDLEEFYYEIVRPDLDSGMHGADVNEVVKPTDIFRDTNNFEEVE
jgi:hypothetical protein